MATEQSVIWVCDRCGARMPPRGPRRPEGWERPITREIDLCCACWQSYCEWEEAARKARQ